MFPLDNQLHSSVDLASTSKIVEENTNTARAPIIAGENQVLRITVFLFDQHDALNT